MFRECHVKVKKKSRLALSPTCCITVQAELQGNHQLTCAPMWHTGSRDLTKPSHSYHRSRQMADNKERRWCQRFAHAPSLGHSSSSPAISATGMHMQP